MYCILGGAFIKKKRLARFRVPALDRLCCLVIQNQLLELTLDEGRPVQSVQAALVDACRQLIAGRLDLVSRKLGDRVVQIPEVASLILGALGSVPEDLDLVHIALCDNFALGEVVEDYVTLVIPDAALGEASEDLGALVEALDAALDDVHQLRHVEVVTVLLSDRILIAQSLHTVGADETEHAHLKADSA